MAGTEFGGAEDNNAYSFLTPLTCARNSKRYLNLDKKGNPVDDDDIRGHNSASKLSFFRSSTRGNNMSRAGMNNNNMEPSSPDHVGSKSRNSRLNDTSPGPRKSKTNLLDTSFANKSALGLN